LGRFAAHWLRRSLAPRRLWLREVVRGMSAMSKQNVRVLLLACLAGGVVFTMCFRAATKSPSLRVGTTIRDPQEYFIQQLRHQAHLPISDITHTTTASPSSVLHTYQAQPPLRVITLISEPNGRYTYLTSFAFLGRVITVRSSAYLFDTNGTVLSINSRRYWPILHF
jgi:hypothetical protein